MTDRSQAIRDRAFRFACAVSAIALSLPPKPGFRSIIDQLLRSGTSVGANLEEAKAASSRREFVRYVEIALREARECHYWIRICLALGIGSPAELDRLRDEADQIARILGSIAVNTKRRTAVGYAVFAFCILNFAFHAL